MTSDFLLGSEAWTANWPEAFARPVDLPWIRDYCVESLDGDYGREALQDAFENRNLRLPGGPGAFRSMLDTQRQRLERADLYYVSEPMEALILGAARSLDDFSLMPEDLPSLIGFIYFARPAVVWPETAELWPGDAGRRCLRGWSGVSWEVNREGLWLTWWTDTRTMIDAFDPPLPPSLAAQARPRERMVPAGVDIVDFNPPGTPRLAWSLEDDGSIAQVPFRDAKPILGVPHWIGILKTAWALMAQPLASVSDADFTRGDRRRYSRARHVEPPAVRVIALRRPAGASGVGCTRDWQHQWVVKGHWRKQWYPSREAHLPVWITPYIKGPEDKPLLGGEKVYSLQR